MEHTNESSWSLCQLVGLYIEAKPLEIDHAQSVMRDRNKADENRESKGWEKGVELPNPDDGWIWEMQGKGFSAKDTPPGEISAVRAAELNTQGWCLTLGTNSRAAGEAEQLPVGKKEKGTKVFHHY